MIHHGSPAPHSVSPMGGCCPSAAVPPQFEWGRHLSSPGGVVSTCSTDQPLRHRRSSVSTRMPVRCDHPTRVSDSPFHVSTSSRSCRRTDGDRSSPGDPERGKSTVRYNRRRSGSTRRDTSVSRSSARRNSPFGSGRWSGGEFRRGRRSPVTSKPPPPPRQVVAGRPTRGRQKSVVHAQDELRVGAAPPWPLSWRRSQPTGRSVSSCTACAYHRSRDAGPRRPSSEPRSRRETATGHLVAREPSGACSRFARPGQSNARCPARSAAVVDAGEAVGWPRAGRAAV